MGLPGQKLPPSSMDARDRPGARAAPAPPEAPSGLQTTRTLGTRGLGVLMLRVGNSEGVQATASHSELPPP